MYPHTKFEIPTSKNIGDMDRTRKRDGRTDGQTDGRTDGAITICLPKFIWGHKNYVIITSLKSETMGKLMNRILGLRLLISSYTRLGSENACWIARHASWCQNAFSKPCLVNMISNDTHLVFSTSRQASQFIKRSQASPGKLDIKRHSPSILYISASLVIQQAFSKPCLVNLISKDTHLVFY